MGVQDNDGKKETDDEEPAKPKLFTLWTHRPLRGQLPQPALKDVTAQEDDRTLVDSLLDQSSDDEGLIGTLFCGDWRDAVTGWSLARPNVKYAWVEKSGKDRKHKNAAKKRKQEDEQQSWKNKIEPGTYKYNPNCRSHPTQPCDVLPAKRQVHPSLQQHIDKVREHLERTLMKQPSSEGLHESKRLAPLPSIETKSKLDASGDHTGNGLYRTRSFNDHNHGQYVVKMSQNGTRRHSIEGSDPQYSSDGGGDADSYFHRNGRGRQSDTKLFKLGKAQNKHQYQDVQAKDNSKAVDLVTALGQKLNEILMEDRLKSLNAIRTVPVTRKIQKNSLFSSATSSYECFPSTEIAPFSNEQPLNPLTKVTPHQRQIHDDNEIAAITSSRQGNTSAGSIVLASDVAPQQTMNKDFIHIGISGQRVESSKSDKTSHNRNGASSPRSSGNKNRMSGSNNKFQKLPLTHSKLESSNEKTGDDLHRGIMDRETAAAVAVSLMPGVSGRKIEVPNV